MKIILSRLWLYAVMAFLCGSGFLGYMIVWRYTGWNWALLFVIPSTLTIVSLRTLRWLS